MCFSFLFFTLIFLNPSYPLTFSQVLYIVAFNNFTFLFLTLKGAFFRIGFLSNLKSLSSLKTKGVFLFLCLLDTSQNNTNNFNLFIFGRRCFYLRCCRRLHSLQIILTNSNNICSNIKQCSPSLQEPFLYTFSHLHLLPRHYSDVVVLYLGNQK